MPKVFIRMAKRKSLFRRINDWLHLWLGLVSGIIIVIVSITGCIYAFQEEISNLTQPYRFVEVENRPFLPPSVLQKAAAARAGENPVLGVNYGHTGKAAIAAYMDKENGYTMIYMNPYTGAILKEKILKTDFFRIILEGHFNLWLPRPIGQPIVATATLIFIVLLISGLIMWWPKKWNKANRNKSFKIKTTAGAKRVNYDLHNVLGFYALTIALVLGITGLVWGFQWFSKSYYWTLTGGKSFVAWERGKSDTTGVNDLQYAEDKIWAKVNHLQGNIQIQFAQKTADPISVTYNPEEGTYYKREFWFYDRYTLKRVPGGGSFAKPYEATSRGEKLYRMNYDIHVGAIAGLPGKILMFFVSLICASLPITGFYIWWGKKKKQKKKKTPAFRRIQPQLQQAEAITL